VSKKYASIGRLSKTKYREVLFKYQEINDKFYEQIYSYSDCLKLFKENRLREVPYLKDLSDPSMHEIIFKLTSISYERGHLILQENSIVDQMIIIVDGLIDIEIVIDDKPVVLESLPNGAVLNYHRFLLGKRFKMVAR
jgi:hypothetical protein